MARFMGFGENLLVDIDSLSNVQFVPKDEDVIFGFNDGTETRYTCTQGQWQRLRDFMKARGLISEV